jgi:hypothetical protein
MNPITQLYILFGATVCVAMILLSYAATPFFKPPIPLVRACLYVDPRTRTLSDAGLSCDIDPITGFDIFIVTGNRFASGPHHCSWAKSKWECVPQ